MAHRALARRCLIVTALVAATPACLPSAITGGDDAGSAASGGNGGTATGNGGSGGGAGGIGDMGVDVAGKFYSDVAPSLKAACGGCHGVSGGSAPAFMLDKPDLLQNLLAYPGIIGDTAETSRLYIKGQHEGPAFTPTQAPTIHDWIALYNASKPAPSADGGTAAPTIKPIAPSLTAANSIDLSVLDPKLAGQKQTFTAKMIGSSIQLSSITVAAAPTIGVHIAHPLFVIWDSKMVPTPDPIDSFSGLDETVYMTQTAPLGPGTLVLPNFAAGSLLSVVFTTAEAKTGTGVTVAPACKALAMFTANVKPLLSANTCSTACHVGATPTAGLKLDATPDATLCVNLLTEINTTTPASSPLLLQPDPAQNAAHPKKINPFTAFQTAVTNWINAEK